MQAKNTENERRLDYSPYGLSPYIQDKTCNLLKSGRIFVRKVAHVSTNIYDKPASSEEEDDDWNILLH